MSSDNAGRGKHEKGAGYQVSGRGVVALTLGMSVSAALFLSAYYVLLPTLPMYLRASGWEKAAIGALASSFSVSSLVVRPVSGVVTDRSGPSRLLAFCGVAFLVVPILFGVGYSVSAFILGQALAGACVGAFTVASNGYLAILAPTDHMGEVVAWFSIALVAAKGFAPAVGTWIYEANGFPLVLICSAAFVPLSMVAFIVTSRICRVGAPSITQKAQPSERRPVSGVRSRAVEGRSLVENKNSNGRVVVLAALVLITITLSYGSIMTFLPIMAKERGLAGYAQFFVIQTAIVVFTRTFSGRIVDVVGAFWVVLVALACLSIALALLSAAHTFSQLVVCAVLYGIGYGASYPSLTATVVKATPVSSRGRAFGVYTAAQDLGLALGQACGGLSQFASFETIYTGIATLPLLGIALLFPLFSRMRSVGRKSSGENLPE